MESVSGKLIVFEGPDGVGKTTLSKEVAQSLNEAGQRCEWVSFPGREKYTLGSVIYKIHHQPCAFEIVGMTQAAKQALHIAAHLDAIEGRIKPILEAGRHVVLDRFWWSTWVYGLNAGIAPDLIRSLIDVERRCWADTKPSIAFLVDVELPREREEEAFVSWFKLKGLYRDLAHQEAQYHQVQIIDNSGPINVSLQELMQAILRTM